MSNDNLVLYTRADEFRTRHAMFLREYLGKNVPTMELSVKIAARTLVCDTAEGETVLPDYKALKKLLKKNLCTLKSILNKTMAETMRTDRVNLPTKEGNHLCRKDRSRNPDLDRR